MSPEKTDHNLNFDLPPQTNMPPARFSAGFPAWAGLLLILLFVTAVANLGVSMGFFSFNPASAPPETRIIPGPDKQKALALKLEEQGLSRPAARAWEQYLAVANPDAEEIALVWYRIAGQLQDAGDYEKALAAYYRSESFAAREDIAAEIALRVQECLEALGKFSALRHELADRVGLDPDETKASENTKPKTNEKILAEIGMQKITRTDLDHHIEALIDGQMGLTKSAMPEQNRLARKKDLFSQLASPENHRMVLGQLIAETLLYRKARETGLADDPKIREMLDARKKSLLAQAYVEKILSERIHLTAADLKTYFEANPETFKTEDNPEPVFEDVKTAVYQSLYAQKAEEIRQSLLSSLKDEYDVVIHQITNE